VFPAYTLYLRISNTHCKYNGGYVRFSSYQILSASEWQETGHSVMRTDIECFDCSLYVSNITVLTLVTG
jgi:hypothetical protein